jgi:hypothetical protein
VTLIISRTGWRWGLPTRWRLVSGGFPPPSILTRHRQGYSYKTNQYGLAIDNIVGYNLVLPNGSVAYVTQSTHPDLFFGLKGGFNNFVGIPPNVTTAGFRLPGCRGS